MAETRLWIPAALTLAGVGCGFVSLICLVQGRYAAGMLWMALAVFFDGIDGKVASMLGTGSELGAVLDSKADVVRFAVLPGVAAYLALGTPGAFLAVYFIAFCTIYIVFHPGPRPASVDPRRSRVFVAGTHRGSNLC